MPDKFYVITSPTKKTLRAFTVLGTAHSSIATVFLGSALTPSPEIICPNYSTSEQAKAHLLLLANNLLSNKICKTCFKCAT